jgi:hypothetical protein
MSNKHKVGHELGMENSLTRAANFGATERVENAVTTNRPEAATSRAAVDDMLTCI